MHQQCMRFFIPLMKIGGIFRQDEQRSRYGGVEHRFFVRRRSNEHKAFFRTGVSADGLRIRFDDIRAYTHRYAAGLFWIGRFPIGEWN